MPRSTSLVVASALLASNVIFAIVVGLFAHPLWFLVWAVASVAGATFALRPFASNFSQRRFNGLYVGLLVLLLILATAAASGRLWEGFAGLDFIMLVGMVAWGAVSTHAAALTLRLPAFVPRTS